MKRLFFIVIAIFVCSVSFGQRYYNKTESDVRYNKVSDNIDPHDSVYYKPEVDLKTGVERIQFIANVTTNAPITGDSIFILKEFTGKHVKLIRAGAVQYQNTTATNGKLGFRLDATNGFIVVRPAFVASELVQVEITNEPNWAYYTIPTKQNLLKYSEELDNAVWFNFNITNTPNIEYDLTGRQTLERIVLAGSTTNALQYTNGGTDRFATIAGTTYYVTYDIIKGTLTQSSYNVTIYEGGTGSIATGNTFSQIIGSAVNRVGFSFTAPVGCTKVTINLISQVTSGADQTGYIGRAMVSTNPNANYAITTTAIIP